MFSSALRAVAGDVDIESRGKASAERYRLASGMIVFDYQLSVASSWRFSRALRLQHHSIAEVSPTTRGRNKFATAVLAKEQSGRLLPACRKKTTLQRARTLPDAVSAR
jgi:hypothetical protein